MQELYAEASFLGAAFFAAKVGQKAEVRAQGPYTALLETKAIYENL